MIPEERLMPGFEEDIFINYDHDDNKPLMTNFRGWVDTMHQSLGLRLTQLIGKAPTIWWDEKRLAGNDPLWETIFVRLENTAFLVSVFSPSYVNSPNCRKELNEFYDRAALRGGIKINNKSRIFKVWKTPINGDDLSIDPLDKSDLPIELRMLLQESTGYQFFEIDEKGKLREFWPELGPEYQKKFLERLEDLAHDIKEFVKSQQAVPIGSDCKKNIFLAETTPELSTARNEIKRTLQQHDYHVLPEGNLPFDSKAFEERVSSYLAESILSIHLIGSDHTHINAEEASTQLRLNLEHQLAAERVRKQHELAMQRNNNDADYSRLIWIPTGIEPREVHYRDFIEYLQNDPAVYENAEVLCGSKLEDLKTIIHVKLKFSNEGHRDDQRIKRVYLIYDKRDQQAVAPLQDFLKQDYEVLLPFKENGGVVSGHRENSRLCDAVLVFYGSINTMNYKLPELRRMDVFRDNKPLLAKGIYIAGPETDHKKEFMTNEALVMKDFAGFSPESLRPFLEQIEKKAA